MVSGIPFIVSTVHWILGFVAENGVEIQQPSIGDVMQRFLRERSKFLLKSSDNQEHRQHRTAIILILEGKCL